MKANPREFRGIVLLVLAAEFILAGLYGQYVQIDILSSLVLLKSYCFLLQDIGFALFLLAFPHFVIDVEASEVKP